MMKTVTSSSVAVSCGSRVRKRMTAVRGARAPTTITAPSTSSALANSEPMIDVWATTTSPARSAKSTTNSSGRLPSVDCSTPVTPGPNRSPTCSVAKLTTCARPASAERREREGEQRRERPRSARCRRAPSSAEDDGDGDPLGAGEGGHAAESTRAAATRMGVPSAAEDSNGLPPATVARSHRASHIDLEDAEPRLRQLAPRVGFSSPWAIDPRFGIGIG